MTLVRYLDDVERDAPPSAYAIADLLDGRPGALTRVAGLTIMRAAFIAPGLYLTGVRERVVVRSLAASATITLGMLAWYTVKR